MSLKPLGEKTFEDADQRRFATASRDWNPMHVDAVAARRLISGRQVVHGIHTLMLALDRWQPGAGGGALQVTCRFAQPVSVGDTVVFSQDDGADGVSRVVAAVGGVACTEVEIRRADGSAAPLPAREGPPRRIDTLAAPLDEDAAQQAGMRFELPAWDDDLARQFPRAAALVGAGGLSALARLSFFVGMVCPGLHSVFSSLQFGAGDGTSTLMLDVRRFDPRFRLFIVDFGGALCGELRAFLRPPPQQQPASAALAPRVAAAAFAGTRSLVIGGSRGLGELTAKLIAAGGGDVAVSYALGRADADAVAADINGAGRGRCEARQLDLQQPFAGVEGLDPATLDAVFYFATPRIYSKRSGVFDRAALDEFVTFYLERFHQLCAWLDGAPRAKPARVYLPSTVFIDERPRGMTEYAMAKAAAEVLADDITRYMPNVQVVHTRLPRLATDQTSSILQLTPASNVDTLLSVVRQTLER